MNPDQLIFDLPSHPAFSREDFMISAANKDAMTLLENWQNWPEGRLAVLGPPGAGKTHLVHVWAEMSGAQILKPGELAHADSARAVAIDDADGIAGTGAEETLFHLYNALHGAGQALLITAKTAPASWPIKLPDLASRLQSVPLIAMSAPDDALLAALMVKQFRDRQVEVTVKLIEYLLKRTERTFSGVRHLVERLDRAAIQQKSPISVTLARRVLRED